MLCTHKTARKDIYFALCTLKRKPLLTGRQKHDMRFKKVKDNFHFSGSYLADMDSYALTMLIDT